MIQILNAGSVQTFLQLIEWRLCEVDARTARSSHWIMQTV